jgi:hypothetical protein
MKFKTTKKAIKEGFVKIVKVGYCYAQTILRFENAVAYSSGSCGWACDYYDLGNGVCISTGYDPIGEKNDIVAKYEALARDVENDYNTSYEVRESTIRDLYSRMVEELKKDLFR